jgi:hypothetical protein
MAVHAELVAVLAAVTQGQPRVLTTCEGRLLPAGPFAAEHRSLQMGLREWVEAQTHHPLGYVEQLYTFADRDRANAEGARVISVSYLGLTREADAAPVHAAPHAQAGESRPARPEGRSGERPAPPHGEPPELLGVQASWQDWYRYFPWEDWRAGPPAILASHIEPALRDWASQGKPKALAERRWGRASLAFGWGAWPWNEDLVLQRYELLYEAGLMPETAGKGRYWPDVPGRLDWRGAPMAHDHRRILATGMARLRAKIKYRPVVFELMPPAFTLLQLQQTVEALAGRVLHKQNFRRLMEQQALVEETGALTHAGAGRPAKLFRFRRDVLLERAISGSKLPLARGPR